MKILGLMAATMVALTACGLPTARDLYGSGPIPNRAYIERGFQEYAKTMTPGYFFVSESGTYGYSYCQASACSGLEMRVAQDACLRSSNGSKCWIYARGSFVVWDEAGPAPSKSSAIRSAPVPMTSAKPEQPPINRPFALRWEGYPSLIAGMISIQPQSANLGDMTIALPNDDGKCTGVYQGREHGTWYFSCTNNLTASGTFKIAGPQAGSTGIGRDSKGRSVEFTVGGSS